jgi:hypothetical protein
MDKKDQGSKSQCINQSHAAIDEATELDAGNPSELVSRYLDIAGSSGGT